MPTTPHISFPVWELPAPSGRFVSNVTYLAWIERNQVKQDAALDLIWNALQAHGTGGDDSDILAGLVVIQSQLTALSTAITGLVATFSRPVRGRIMINDKESRHMPIPISDSQTFTYSIVYDDLAGREVPENAPTDWTVVDLTGAPSTLATLTPDPTSDEKGTGTLTASSGSFKLHAAMGTLNFESDELDIVPGSPATGVITVTAV